MSADRRTTIREGVVLFDAPPTVGHNLQRAVNEAAAAEGVHGTVTHLAYTDHLSDHAGGSSTFGTNVARIGHEECRRLMTGITYRSSPAPAVRKGHCDAATPGLEYEKRGGLS